MSTISELNLIVTLLKSGANVPSVSIRSFLSWFGVQRRTRLNVEYINNELQSVGIRTVPEYVNTWVDNNITFDLISNDPEGQVDSGNIDAAYPQDERLEHLNSDDPSFKIGKIIHADSGPVSVKPNATLREVTTIMLTKNFSQVPVMTSEREVKGVVTWDSIGVRNAAGVIDSGAQSYMIEHRELSASATLFDAIRVIKEAGYVLVRAPDRRIIGIVTATDIAEQFETISTPFLLLTEIENHLRALVAKYLTKNDIKKACGSQYLPEDFSGPAELTFGNLVKALEYPGNWEKLTLQMDRIGFCAELSQVNRIRNDVAHFDPDPITAQDISKLRNIARLLDSLRSMSAF